MTDGHSNDWSCRFYNKVPNEKRSNENISRTKYLKKKYLIPIKRWQKFQ